MPSEQNFKRASSREDEHARRWTLGRLAPIACSIAIFFFLLDFPHPPTGRFLDTGWALAFGHFMKTRQQAGVDYVFTYGPLGYLVVPVYVPGLFWLKYVWAISFAAAASFVLTRLMVNLPSLLLRAAWLFVALRILPHSETLYIVLVVGAPLLHLLEDRWSVDGLVFTCGLLATLGLVKFTFLAFGLAALSILAVAAPQSERKRFAGWTAGLFLAFIATLWVVAGQSLSNFPRFVSASLEMVRGYTDAMTLIGSASHVAGAHLVLFGIVAGLVLVPPKAWVARRRLSGTALLAAGLFLAWKEGFVRQDPQHETVFFGYAVIFSLLVRAFDPQPSDERLLRVGFLLVAGLTGMGALAEISKETRSDWWTLARSRELVSIQATILVNPGDHLQRARAVWVDEQRKWLLPEIRARVGADSIDTTSFDQTTVFWNAFNWRQRPAFQGYAAYTPELARRNAEFLIGPSAPRYVLANWFTIDERYPPEDDGPFLIELFRRYHPVASEREYILLERRDPADVRYLHGRVVDRRSAWFGEPIQLDADSKNLTTLSVEIDRTLAGKLRHFLYRPPKIEILVELAEGAPHRYRFVPGLSSAEFLVNPFFEANVDLYPIYGGVGRRVRSVSLLTDAEGRKCFGESFHVTVRCYGERGGECE